MIFKIDYWDFKNICVLDFGIHFYGLDFDRQLLRASWTHSCQPRFHLKGLKLFLPFSAEILQNISNNRNILFRTCECQSSCREPWPLRLKLLGKPAPRLWRRRENRKLLSTSRRRRWSWRSQPRLCNSDICRSDEIFNNGFKFVPRNYHGNPTIRIHINV